MNRIFSFVFFILTAFLLSSCNSQNRPIRDCQIGELLLSDMDFPSGTFVDPISSPVSEYPEESAGRTAVFSDDLIYHVVGRYLSSDGAQRKFADSFDLAFDDNKYEGPWAAPSGFSYTSSIANQFYVACGNTGTKHQCRMIGQYEEYYVFFFSYVSDSGMNITIYQDLLDKIDDKMAQCLR
ncbi:MAG: hypothetical protein PGMFKBFP_02846 [Anaerolineales bacterium]|nr:hypothetical protein [Anaerolineales bacterium]